MVIKLIRNNASNNKCMKTKLNTIKFHESITIEIICKKKYDIRPIAKTVQHCNRQCKLFYLYINNPTALKNCPTFNIIIMFQLLWI